MTPDDKQLAETLEQTVYKILGILDVGATKNEVKKIGDLIAAQAWLNRERDTIAVPRSALNWLFGSGPDANGQWFDRPEGVKQIYWWRSHFRKLIGPAAPQPEKE